MARCRGQSGLRGRHRRGCPTLPAKSPASQDQAGLRPSGSGMLLANMGSKKQKSPFGRIPHRPRTSAAAGRGTGELLPSIARNLTWLLILLPRSPGLSDPQRGGSPGHGSDRRGSSRMPTTRNLLGTASCRRRGLSGSRGSVSQRSQPAAGKRQRPRRAFWLALAQGKAGSGRGGETGVRPRQSDGWTPDLRHHQELRRLQPEAADCWDPRSRSQHASLPVVPPTLGTRNRNRCETHGRFLAVRYTVSSDPRRLCRLYRYCGLPWTLASQPLPVARPLIAEPCEMYPAFLCGTAARPLVLRLGRMPLVVAWVDWVRGAESKKLTTWAYKFAFWAAVGSPVSARLPPPPLLSAVAQDACQFSLRPHYFSDEEDGKQ